MGGNNLNELKVCVDYDDPVVAELIHASLSTLIPRNIQSTAAEAQLQWSPYEELDFDSVMKNPETTLCNSYIFRKALIRKHFLANTIQTWLSKHPETILRKHTPKTYLLECDYADYLDEALNEAFELRDALEDDSSGKWFILKPSMTDRGQGIRLFSTREELEAIFEAFEEDDDDGDVDVVASQVRYFVVQEYIREPLLLKDGKKFHVRCYVVAFGGIKVWVWSEMLALFALVEYELPSCEDDLQRHLTNTCLQDDAMKEGSVKRFWDLALEGKALKGIFKQICDVTGEIFLAAASGQQMHFQVRPIECRRVDNETLPNAFETFGVDFLIDKDHQVYLLEINSYPDFRQTGQRLTDHVVGGLFNAVTREIICPFFKITPNEAKDNGENGEWKAGQLELVLDVQLRKW